MNYFLCKFLPMYALWKYSLCFRNWLILSFSFDYTGNAYLLENEIDEVTCCGKIKQWKFMAKNTGSLKFIVWRKTAHPGINYNRVVVGTYKVYVSCKFYSINVHLRSLLKYVLICFYDTVVPPVICPLPIKGHPSYQARFQMHWDSKILLINPPQERPPLFYNHFFTADEVALQEGNAVLILAKFVY